jgi:hypothetical protein
MKRRPVRTPDTVIPPEVLDGYIKQEGRLTSTKGWRSCFRAHRSIIRAVFRRGILPCDPRFNAVLWAGDVIQLCREIGHSYCWMRAYADFHGTQYPPGSEPSDADFHLSYYADNAITRIDSCRDKLALMVWAYYCPFNPENRHEVLCYEEIVERLRYPVKFGLAIRSQGAFLRHLDTLVGPDLKRVETYRNLKIHRREPRVMLRDVRPSDDWDYVVPLTDEKDIANWRERMAETYSDPAFREDIERRCRARGGIFDRRRLKDRLWEYEKVRRCIESCLIALLAASGGCFRVLGRRAPLVRPR